MLKNLYQIGKNVEWESEVLKKIKPYIDLTKEQLAAKSKPVAANARGEEN